MAFSRVQANCLWKGYCRYEHQQGKCPEHQEEDSVCKFHFRSGCELFNFANAYLKKAITGKPQYYPILNSMNTMIQTMNWSFLFVNSKKPSIKSQANPKNSMTKISNSDSQNSLFRILRFRYRNLLGICGLWFVIYPKGFSLGNLKSQNLNLK